MTLHYGAPLLWIVFLHCIPIKKTGLPSAQLGVTNVDTGTHEKAGLPSVLLEDLTNVDLITHEESVDLSAHLWGLGLRNCFQRDSSRCVKTDLSRTLLWCESDEGPMDSAPDCPCNEHSFQNLGAVIDLGTSKCLISSLQCPLKHSLLYPGVILFCL